MFKVQRKIFAPVLDFTGTVSMARQEFKASSDMNNIVAKFLRTGILEQPNLVRETIDDGMMYKGDFSESVETALEMQRSDAINENESVVDNTQSGSQDDLQSVHQGESSIGEGSKGRDAGVDQHQTE